MSKIGTSVSVPVSSHADAYEKLMATTSRMKAKVVSDAGGTVTLKRGSQAKMRLIGGFFVSDADLPVLATVTFDPASPNNVQVVVVENVVVGIIAGMGDKYQRSCTEFAKLIASVVSGDM